MLKENLVELPIYKPHPNRIQYYVNYGKIIWPNQFSYKIDKKNEYERIKNKFDRRFVKLITKVKEANKILFLFSFFFEVSIEPFKFLYDTLTQLYPTKMFEIKVVSFNSKEAQTINDGNITIYKYVRDSYLDDFNTTTSAWDFIDDVVLSLNLVQLCINTLILIIKLLYRKIKKWLHI